MNASVYSADRATYLRIVIVTVLASIAIVALAISARIGDHRSPRSAAVALPSWSKTARVPDRASHILERLTRLTPINMRV
jgi:hypothetical protein